MMDTSPEKYMERLVEVLQKKQGILKEILALTQAQTQSINENGIESLQKLVDEKQLKIDVVDKLDEEFNVYFQRLKTSLKIASLDELDASGIVGAKKLKDVTTGIVRVITAISKIEKLNNEKAKGLLDQLGGEIKRINQGKKMNAYTPSPPKIPSYFIDKKK